MIGMTLPDLICESVLRDGFAVLKRNPELIDKIFKRLTSDYSDKKYGQKELERLKDQIIKKDISIVHSFGEVDANLPCISIQLGDESEAKDLAHLSDYDGILQEEILDPDDLANLVVISGFTPTGYDSQSGAVSVNDGVDLSDVHINLIFVDASGNQFVITGGINQTPGDQQFSIAIGSTPDISGACLIKSAIDYTQSEVKGIHSEVQLLLGIHTKDALLTKYFYVLTKYLLVARKKSLIKRNFICSSFRGSDFTRNLKYQADIVYTRYLTLTGKVQEDFTSELDQIFDNIEINLLIPRDVASNEDLGLQTQTIQVNDNYYQSSEEDQD